MEFSQSGKKPVRGHGELQNRFERVKTPETPDEDEERRISI